MKKTVFFLFLLLTALGAGFWFSRANSSHTTSFPGLNAPGSPETPGRTARGGTTNLGGSVTEKLTIEQIVARLEDECQHGIWQRTKEWEIIFNSLSPAEMGQLMTAVKHLVLSPEQEELRKTLFSRWGECDPAAALAFANEFPESVMREDVIKMVLQGWLCTNADEAIAWIRTLPAGVTRSEAINLAIPYLAAKNPAAALDLVGSLPPSQRTAAYTTIFGLWAASDPAAAATQAEKLKLVGGPSGCIANHRQCLGCQRPASGAQVG